MSGIAYSILLTALINVAASSLFLFDPKEDVKRARRVIGGSAIPLEKGEKMVVYAPKNNRATSVVILVNSTYERVERELRNVVSEKIGIVSEGQIGDRDEGIFPEKEPRPKGLLRILLFGRGFIEFRAIGVRLAQPKEYQLKSRKYNEVKELDGSSELRLRMTDGKVLFGKDCALIVMSRIDRSKQYLRYYDIPLPPKQLVEDDLVTDTEIKLIENVAGRLGDVRPHYFVPYPGSNSEKYWIDFMTKVREIAKDF